MKLDVRAASLAAGGVAALVYALCAAFCIVVPRPTVLYMAEAFLHMDVSSLYKPIGWDTFLVGFLTCAVYVGLMGGATAWLYNRLARTGTERSLSATFQTSPLLGVHHE
jgi:hypothetical protein